MKPIWNEERGKLSVELHKPEEATLQKARAIGRKLVAMHQEEGQALVDAVDKILMADGGTNGLPDSETDGE